MLYFRLLRIEYFSNVVITPYHTLAVDKRFQISFNSLSWEKKSALHDGEKKKSNTESKRTPQKARLNQ